MASTKTDKYLFKSRFFIKNYVQYIVNFHNEAFDQNWKVIENTAI